MDLTRKFNEYLKNRQQENQSSSVNLNYNFNLIDNKIWFVMESLNEIAKLKKLFKNYFKIQDKIINLNEFVSDFFKDKNQFIENLTIFINSSQQRYKEKENYLSLHSKTIYHSINLLFKSRLDELLASYKILNQKIAKKKTIASNYWKDKEEFLIRNYNIKNKKSLNNENKKENKESRNESKTEIYNNVDDYTYSTNENMIIIEPPKEKWVFQYLPQNNKSADETINILNDLSNLVKTFSQKVYFHNEMTNQSKFLKFFKHLLFYIVLSNVSEAVENVDKANDDLKYSKEESSIYSFYMGVLFLVLGGLLLLLDFQL